MSSAHASGYATSLRSLTQRGIILPKQARQDSNLQPPALEPTPRNAGVATFVDSQRLSFYSTPPALLDNAGVRTHPDTVHHVRASGSRLKHPVLPAQVDLE